MNTDSHTPRTAGFLARYYVEILSVLAVLFVLQTGLVPFDYLGGEPGRGAPGDFFGARRSSFTLPDIVANTFLYIPIGILFHWSAYRRVRNGLAALLLTVGLGTALSGGIEWMQSYSTARVSSVIDLLSNMSGTCAGGLIALRCRMLLPSLLRRATTEFRHRPQAMVVKAYACGLLFVGAMPFSFSLDVNMFKKSLKTVTLVPFGTVMTSDTAAADVGEMVDAQHSALVTWGRLKCWSRWAVELAAFAILAWLAYPILRDDYRFTHGAATKLIWWYCGIFAAGLSLLQLLLVTRGFDITDVLFRLLGIASGLTLRLRHVTSAANLTPEALAFRNRKLAFLGSLAVLVYIVYVGLIPFTFDTTEGALERALASTNFLPFFGYFTTRFDLMIADVMEKFVAYALLAALLATCWTGAGRLALTSRAVVLGAVGVAVAMPLELVQVYMPVRVAGLTDLILAACACASGTVAQEHAVAFCRSAALRRNAGTEHSLQEQRYFTGRPVLTPADKLVASLVDPMDDAPTESAPGTLPCERERVATRIPTFGPKR